MMSYNIQIDHLKRAPYSGTERWK